MQNNRIQFMLVLFLLALGACCTRHQVPKEIEVFPKEDLKVIIDSFAMQNQCSYCIYEIFIDKTAPNHSNILITMGKYPLTDEENKYENQQSLLVTYSQGIKFHIYSGVERYFSNDVHHDRNKDTKLTEYEYKQEIWWVVDSAGNLKVRKIDLAYPFQTWSYKNYGTLDELSQILRPK